MEIRVLLIAEPFLSAYMKALLLPLHSLCADPVNGPTATPLARFSPERCQLDALTLNDMLDEFLLGQEVSIDKLNPQ